MQNKIFTFFILLVSTAAMAKPSLECNVKIGEQRIISGLQFGSSSIVTKLKLETLKDGSPFYLEVQRFDGADYFNAQTGELNSVTGDLLLVSLKKLINESFTESDKVNDGVPILIGTSGSFTRSFSDSHIGGKIEFSCLARDI
jgi:hypothetical protein